MNSTSTTSTSPHLDKYHHSHFISATTWGATISLSFLPFTGQEPEPDFREDPELSRDDRQLLFNEHHMARLSWEEARFGLRAWPALAQAAPIQRAYVWARETMGSAFVAFSVAEDNRSRAQLLKAHQAALTATQAWDDAARTLTELEKAQLTEPGQEDGPRLADVAFHFGMDIKDWHLPDPSAYERPDDDDRRGTPLMRELLEEIERHKEHLEEIPESTGDH